jgi:hypothetical protein
MMIRAGESAEARRKTCSSATSLPINLTQRHLVLNPRLRGENKSCTHQGQANTQKTRNLTIALETATLTFNNVSDHKQTLDYSTLFTSSHSPVFFSSFNYALSKNLQTDYYIVLMYLLSDFKHKALSTVDYVMKTYDGVEVPLICFLTFGTRWR